MEEDKQKTIKVTVEKGHLFTLGERMYVESIELIRELVNNAYDADATVVHVTVHPASVMIEDDGSGMDERGLKQFFTVGSEEKRVHSISPRFGRKRIGQFGIGKFAALAAADRFVVESKKGKWIYTVVFDRHEWQKSERWELPITKELATPLHREGTRVTLAELKKHFSPLDVEKYLKESVPLRARKFAIFLNGKRISARVIPGRRYPIALQTMYGSIEGEIVVALKSSLVDKPGIECRVRQVLVRREFFDLEKIHSFGLSRIAGEVNADFLPITSGRCDFLRDSPEFKLFYQLMHAQLDKILRELRHESNARQLKRIKEELKDILSKIRQALELHPELTPTGRSLAMRRKRKDELVGSTVHAASPTHATETTAVTDTKLREREPRKEKQEEPSVPPLPKPEFVKRIRLKTIGVSVAVVALGSDEPEALSQGNLIYLNSDHPLFQKLQKKRDQFEIHLLRLITQEIVMMKKMRLNAQDAFEWQSKLLTDALCGAKESDS
ncbi:MAG: ATP-binding protein [Patescibacteria group bacterium]